MAGTFQQLSTKKVSEMTEEEFATAMKSTQLQNPVVSDLKTLGDFKVIMYKENVTK